jgi:putative CocE/NonD family hydrolase
MEQFEAVTVEFDVPARMRDGTILRANIYRPAGEGRRPVLLCRLPYGKDLLATGAEMDPVKAARRGYVVVVQDVRGTSRSDGDWYPFRAEAADGVDTIAWAAGLPFADGQVGMFGGSYLSFAQWAAAIQQPPALKALFPIAIFADPLNGAIYRGGAFELGSAAWWHLLMALGPLVRRHGQDPPSLDSALAAWAAEFDALGPTGYASLPLAEFAPLRRQGPAPAFFEAVGVPLDRAQDPLATITFLGKHEQVRIPSFHVGCWYDIFLADTIAAFQATRAQGTPTKLLIGPWMHGRLSNPIGERNFGIGAQAATLEVRTDLGSLELRWFDHWLKGRDTGMLDEGQIRFFVMGANVWRDEQEWPLARAIPTPWYLHEDGGLSRELPGAEAPDRYDYDPANPVPTVGGATLMAAEYPAGPRDQRAIEARPDVLVYTSEPLQDDTEVTGPITVRLWAVSSVSDTDFVARLTDVFPDGRSINLTDGIVRARYRSLARGEPPSLVEPGRAYEYAIDLWATSNVFLAGHRIRLQVTSSSFPRWDRNPNTGHPFGTDAEMRVAQQTILHDSDHPSHVVLPMVHSRGA